MHALARRLVPAACCAWLPAAAMAQDAPTASRLPQSGFYVGAGVSFNAVDFGTDDVYAVGTSDVFRNGVLISTGSAAGPGSVALGTEAAIAPTLQAGYFRRFPDSEWLWGATVSYAYLGSTATVRNALLPQAGSFTPTGSTTPVPFTGNAVVRSYESKITHQIALLPYIGHTLGSGFVYGGAGPTLSRTQTNLNGLVGFARLDGTPSDVSGAPQDFESSGWVFGGAAMVGATFFIDQGWFVDVRYTYAATQSRTGNYASTFTNPNGANGTVTTGTLIGNSSGSVTTQSLGVSINRIF